MADDQQKSDLRPAAASAGDDVAVELEDPIEAHGDTISVLRFRRPTPRDLKKCGYPFKFGEDGNTFVTGPVNALIAELAGIPPSSVDKLSLADWNECGMALMGFFQRKRPERAQ